MEMGAADTTNGCAAPMPTLARGSAPRAFHQSQMQRPPQSLTPASCAWPIREDAHCPRFQKLKRVQKTVQVKVGDDDEAAGRATSQKKGKKLDQDSKEDPVISLISDGQIVEGA